MDSIVSLSARELWLESSEWEISLFQDSLLAIVVYSMHIVCEIDH